MLKFCYLCFVLCALCLTTGCATVMEGAKGFAGLSTKVLEDNRENAITKTFPYDYDTCNLRVEKKLKRIGSYVYTKNTKKKMIALYVSESDTTPVGIFFKEINAEHTQIEVSSPSKYAKEFMANKIFTGIENYEEEEEEERKKKEVEEGTNAQK